MFFIDGKKSLMSKKKKEIAMVLIVYTRLSR